MSSSKLLLLAALSAFTASVTAADPAPATPTNVAKPPLDYAYVGCYSHPAGDNTFKNLGPGASVGGSENMTVEHCINGCNAYPYAYDFVGLEYSSEVCSQRIVLL